MEFSIKLWLGGSSMKENGLKMLYFARKAFYSDLFFPIMTPPLTLGTIGVGIPRGVKGVS